MMVLFDWLASDGGRALLLALAHSVWVGGLAWAALALLFRRLPARRCQLRYGLALGAQGLVCGVALFLWSWFAHAATEAQVAPASSRPGTAATIEPAATNESAAETAETAPTLAAASDNSLEDAGLSNAESLPQADQRSTVDAGSRPSAAWPQWWGLTWLAGALVVLVSRMWRLGQTWRLSACCPVITDGPWQMLLAEERLRMAYGKAVVLRVVEGLASPAAWGFFRPVILIPASMASGLSPETMRMILAHELSHLRRWDPLVQALQYVVEALFFFNPFIWLLSRQIALEREACCDAVAADRTDAPTYAEVLLAVGRQAGRSRHNVAAPAALGDGKRSSLAARIGRLLRPADCPSPRLSLRLLLLAVLIALVAVVVGRQASDAAVTALSHQEWIQQIQTVLNQERQEQTPVWQDGDKMIIKGRITNQAGEPLPKASVRLQMHYADGSPGRTISGAWVDAEGRFQAKLELTDLSLANRPHSSVIATMVAPGYQVERRQVSIIAGEAEQDFTLEPGLPVEIECVDEAGSPVAATDLELEYAGKKFECRESATTDAQGRLRLRLPSDEVLEFTVRAEGYRDWYHRASFGSAPGSMRIILRKGPPIRGVVRDAVSGEPIAGAGIFSLGSLSGDGNASRWFPFRPGRVDPGVRTNAEGMFEVYSLGENWVHWLAIEAEGYLTGFPGAADSRKSYELDATFAVTPGGELVEVNLIPKKPLMVKILAPKGWPAVGTTSGRLRYSQKYEIPSVSYGNMPVSQRENVEVQAGVIETMIEPVMALPLRIGLNPIFGPELTLEGWDYGEPLVVDLRDQRPKTIVERKYAVRFDLPLWAPLPAGEIKVHYVGPANASGERVAPIEAGIARFTIRHQMDQAPKINSSRVIGYVFEEQELHQPRDASDPGPVVHTVWAARPAGALTLKIENADPNEPTQVVLEALKKEDGGLLSLGAKKEWVTLQTKEVPVGTTEAVISPVPLGQKLLLSVHQGVTWTRKFLPPVRESDPLPQLEIQIPAGERVAGQVFGPAGQALGDVRVGLDVVFRTESHTKTYHYPTRTDTQGTFAFERVNFDADAIYYLRVMQAPDCQEYISKLEKPERDLQIRLKPAIPRIVRLVAAETGEPVVGRTIQISELGPPARQHFKGIYLNPEIRTDAQGELPINGLPATGRFTFFVAPAVGQQTYHTEEIEIDADDETIVIRVPEARLR